MHSPSAQQKVVWELKALLKWLLTELDRSNNLLAIACAVSLGSFGN